MASRAEIGKKLRDARKELGYTQKRLVEITGINKTTISQIENGYFTGSFDIFERVLDAVGFQLDAVPKKIILPKWEEIAAMFAQDDE